MIKWKKYPHLCKIKESKECINCGGWFIPNRKEQKYCGKECWSHRAVVINKCLLCSKDVRSYKSIDKKYCWLECRNKHYRERFTWENSHLWEWWKTLKSKCLKTSAAYREWRIGVFTRDQFSCVLCWTKDRTIEADHILAQSEYPEFIYDINNWRTLCHECHKQTENYWWKQQQKLSRKSLNKGLDMSLLTNY